jgi:hypothetical protein
MDTKKILIGAGSGYVSNSVIQNGMRDTWAKIGIDYSKQAVALYDKFIKEGKTPEEATTMVENASPAWKKLGSNRVNGLIGAGLGALLTQVNNDNVRTAGLGMAIFGGLKVLFPSQMTDIDFTWNK